MIHYAVMAGSAGAVDRTLPRLRAALEATAYFDGERLELVASDRSWALAAIECPDPLASRRIVSNGDAFVVFNGPALAVDSSQSEIGSRLLAAFSTGGVDAVDSVASGTYNVVGAAPAHGVQAAIDFTGLSPLYWAQAEGLTVFSNRSSSVQHLLGGGGLDPFALSWLASLNQAVGPSTSVDGVHQLLPHEVVRVAHGSATPVVERRSKSIWSPPGDELQDRLSPQEWDEVTDDLIAAARPLAAGSDLTLLLSGGFDSRVCLAVAKAAGLASSTVAVTRGMPDHPEMAPAVEAATAAGFRHVQRPPIALSEPASAPTAAPDRAPDGELSSPLWRRLRQAAYRFETSVCPWDGLSPLSPIKGTIVEIKGHLGGLFKGPGKAYADGGPHDLDDLASKLFHYRQPNDPLGVVRPEHTEHQKAWVQDWVRDGAAEIRVDQLPLRYYLEQRVANWNGPLQQFTPGRISINLLSSVSAVRAATKLTPAAAGSHRFHYEVMKRAAPELVPIPFFNARWADEIAADGEFDLSRPPYPAPEIGLARSVRSWQWEFLTSESEAIEGLFAEASDTVLGDVYLIDELKAAARRAPEMKRAVEARSMLSAVAIALSATGKSEPVLDQPLADF